MTVPANYGTEYSVEFPYRNAAYTALAAYAATALLKYSITVLIIYSQLPI